ncbi:MAG: hypothetical protein JKY61_09770 [Planctomycetes bacterium]|nr:hypothetical protein [Planctomycetota bacterium]
MKTLERRIPALLGLLTLLLTGASTWASQADNSAAGVRPTDAMMLRFPDGGVRIGFLDSHDSTGIRFQSARHGGVVFLPWERLHASQSLALRTELGYVETDAEELLIPVERLVLASGQEILGVILSKEGSNFLMKVNGNTQVVPKNRVVSVTAGEMAPALDVYKTEELYAQGLARLKPEDALSQVELAEYCERILDFPHAVVHLTAAIALRDGAQETSVWQKSLTRASVKAQQADQLDRLREIDRLRRRSLFPQAMEKVTAFRQAFPKSPLVDDLNKSEALVVRTKERVLGERIQKRLFYRTTQMIRAVARQKGQTMDSLTALMDGDWTDNLRAAVAADVRNLEPEITPDLVGQYWMQRHKRRFHVATYGNATWLLGEDRVNAGLEKSERKSDKKVKAKATAQDPQSEFQERIQRFLQNQRRAARASFSGSKDQVAERETAWGLMTLEAKSMWLLAYYVEFSGEFEVRPAVAHLCRTCGGNGVLETAEFGITSSNATRGGRLSRCHTCHGVGIVRRVRFR